MKVPTRADPKAKEADSAVERSLATGVGPDLYMIQNTERVRLDFLSELTWPLWSHQALRSRGLVGSVGLVRRQRRRKERRQDRRD